MLFFHSISFSPRTIFVYWKDLLSVTSKASVFKGPFSGICYPTNALPATDFHWFSAFLFFERPLVALVYHPPVAQIIIYHSQQVIWNFFPHHRLDAAVPPRGIKRIAYVNADQRAESLTLTISSSCLSGDVHHCLDGVNCGSAFPKAELVFRETVLADHVTL